MRIDALRLLAFGPFTGHVLDLSKGAEGLHIVYGPNEAGKSTVLRAITQVLFGIPQRSTDSFVHPYDNMRIGLRLRGSSGETLDVVRRKGRAKTLRDRADKKVVDEAELRRFTASVREETFGNLFAFGHEELVAGGQAILLSLIHI